MISERIPSFNCNSLIMEANSSVCCTFEQVYSLEILFNSFFPVALVLSCTIIQNKLLLLCVKAEPRWNKATQTPWNHWFWFSELRPSGRTLTAISRKRCIWSGTGRPARRWTQSSKGPTPTRVSHHQAQRQAIIQIKATVTIITCVNHLSLGKSPSTFPKHFLFTFFHPSGCRTKRPE